jgi:hypothetical protein
MKKILTAIFLTTILSSFGQTGKLNCVCAESQIKADTKPDTIFYLQNGTPISFCGYKVKDSNPPVYLKFVLAFCLPDTLLDIDIWRATQSCYIRISGDTLLVDEIETNTTDKIYLNGLDVVHKTVKTKTVKTTKSVTPIQTVDRIFKDYIKYSESTDSQDDKDAMTKALQALKQSKSETDLIVLINVWMYYDPTDFPSRDLVYKILANSRPESIYAVKTRISKKKNWETDDTAPYSELKDLLKQLDE